MKNLLLGLTLVAAFVATAFYLASEAGAVDQGLIDYPAGHSTSVSAQCLPDGINILYRPANGDRVPRGVGIPGFGIPEELRERDWSTVVSATDPFDVIYRVPGQNGRDLVFTYVVHPERCPKPSTTTTEPPPSTTVPETTTTTAPPTTVPENTTTTVPEVTTTVPETTTTVPETTTTTFLETTTTVPETTVPVTLPETGASDSQALVLGITALFGGMSLIGLAQILKH